MTEPAIQFDHTSRVYGSGRVAIVALHPTVLEVASGELVAIMGASGSGKSSLLSLAGGLDAPTEGRVVVEGEDLSRLSAGQLAGLRRRSIGYVFQDCVFVHNCRSEKPIKSDS